MARSAYPRYTAKNSAEEEVQPVNISPKDRKRLRELAGYQSELAASSRNQRLYQDWMAYSDFSVITRPMILIETYTFLQDILPAMMKCEGEDARSIETLMLLPIANFTLFEDDTLVPDHYSIRDPFFFKAFGLDVKRTLTAGLGYRFIPYLTTLGEDGHLLRPSAYGVDEAGAGAQTEEMDELFGDILPVRRDGTCYGACLMLNIIRIMSMDDMFIAMLEEENRWHDMMRRLTDDYLAYFHMLEEGGHLYSAARGQSLRQGSYCFTNELPDGRHPAKLTDLWAYCDSQETSAISPSMYEEMVFPYYREIMDAFGLISYGCCEASDPIWDNCLSKVKNLRKVSVSHWCNEAYMGERLRGKNITYLRKPDAAFLGVGKELDEARVRAYFRKTHEASRGCRLEIARKDVYRINNSPEKVRRYVELIRMEVDR